MRNADLETCYGWAYEQCGRPAVWVLVEQSCTSSYWSAYGVCKEHARKILNAWGTETDLYVRTWYPVSLKHLAYVGQDRRLPSLTARRRRSLQRWSFQSG